MRHTVSRGTAIVVAVCLLALVLRLIGLPYGLPAVYNPDEVAIMARALSFATGTLNPHNFLYPTFYFYVLFAWVGMYLAFVWLTGRVQSLAALQRLYFTDQTGIFTAGGTLGVAAGTATVFLLHRLAGRLTDSRAAIAAAWPRHGGGTRVRFPRLISATQPRSACHARRALVRVRHRACVRSGQCRGQRSSS